MKKKLRQKVIAQMNSLQKRSRSLASFKRQNSEWPTTEKTWKKFTNRSVLWPKKWWKKKKWIMQANPFISVQKAPKLLCFLGLWESTRLIYSTMTQVIIQCLVLLIWLKKSTLKSSWLKVYLSIRFRQEKLVFHHQDPL